MKIDSINNEYLTLQSQILEKNETIRKWQQEINILAEDYQIEEAERIKARRDNDIQRESKASKNIDIIKKKVSEIDAKAEIEKIEIEDLIEKIDELLNLLFSDVTMKEDVLNVLEERYTSKIEKLVNKKQILEKEQRKVEQIREILQSNPSIGKQVEKIIKASIELERINFVIENLEHNGMLDKTEKSNIELLHKNKKEKQKQERIMNDSEEEIKNNLCIVQYEFIMEKIDEIIQTSIKQKNRVDVNKVIKNQVKTMRNQIQQIEKSIDDNKKELTIVQQKNRKKTKIIREENKREDFLRRMNYEIVQYGINLMKEEIREESKSKEETR